jgi:hypothetical protein
VLRQESVRLFGVGPRQGQQHVAGEQLVDPHVVLSQPSSYRASAKRSLRMAASVLVLTVPIGMPSSSAITRLRLAVEVRHLEHLLLRRRKGRERGANLLAPNAQVRVLDDVLRRVFAGRGLEVRRTLGAAPEALLTADGIDGPVMDQGQEEGPERPRAGRNLRRAPEREEASWASCAISS